MIASPESSSDHFIGGERVASSAERFDRHLARSTASALAEISRGDADDGRRQPSRAAHDAFPAWAALGAAGRAPYLHRLADLIDANVDRLADVECADMAMLLRSLRARVISRGARNYRAYADLAARVRGARLALERHLEPRPAHARRPGRRDHAVERAVHALDLEDGARARRRLHGRAQAGGVVARSPARSSPT